MIKRIGRLFLYFLGAILLLLLIVLSQSVPPEQVDYHEDNFNFPDTLANHKFDMDSLLEVVGSNKGLPDGFELAALIAYSSYPELKDVRIDMELTTSGAPMESNFDLITLFGPRSGRVYKIYLHNGENTPFDEILLRALPFDAQVGILAHELGHVAYYHRLNTIQIGKWGIKYLFDSEFRAIHERTTDLMPIYHGLGAQIWEYAWFIRNDPSCVEMYKQFGSWLDEFYMTDVELKQAILDYKLNSR